jgi:hypothetical protein
MSLTFFISFSTDAQVKELDKLQKLAALLFSHQPSYGPRTAFSPSLLLCAGEGAGQAAEAGGAAQ